MGTSAGGKREVELFSSSYACGGPFYRKRGFVVVHVIQIDLRSEKEVERGEEKKLARKSLMLQTLRSEMNP